MKRIIILALLGLLLVCSDAQAGSYPSTAAANSLMAKTARGPCGDGLFTQCIGVYADEMLCEIHVGNNAVYCAGYYHENHNGVGRLCWFNDGTRVGKRPDGSLFVVAYSDTCHGRLS